VVDWLSDGPRIDAALAGGHYDLVLFDLDLPGKDGLAIPRSLCSLACAAQDDADSGLLAVFRDQPTPWDSHFFMP
jgi:hypothetical protein